MIGDGLDVSDMARIHNPSFDAFAEAVVPAVFTLTGDNQAIGGMQGVLGDWRESGSRTRAPGLPPGPDQQVR